MWSWTRFIKLFRIPFKLKAERSQKKILMSLYSKNKYTHTKKRNIFNRPSSEWMIFCSFARFSEKKKIYIYRITSLYLLGFRRYAATVMQKKLKICIICITILLLFDLLIQIQLQFFQIQLRWKGFTMDLHILEHMLIYFLNFNFKFQHFDLWPFIPLKATFCFC